MEQQKKCPICQAAVDVVYQSRFKKAFVHTYTLIGLEMYGPYQAAEELKCKTEKYLHFVFLDGSTRLVELGADRDTRDGESLKPKY